MFDVAAVRADFPLLSDPANHDLIYLDNAATTHKPNRVIEAISDCYRHYNAPVHRGLYPLAEEASKRYEQARRRLANFIGSEQSEQLIFTRSATESINMVAQGWLANQLQEGDEVWVSRMEHHANYLPWQRVCEQHGARLRVIELNPDGTLNPDASPDMYGPRSKLIAVGYVSNVLGVINPVQQMIHQARTHGIAVLVDATQAVGHIPVDVSELGCDFLAAPAHKMYGPTGIGLLYARTEHLQQMEPLLVGGGMVDQVNETTSIWAPYPEKFEAGSPNLAGALGFAAAADYIDQLGIERSHQHVMALTRYALEQLSSIEGLQIYGPKTLEHRSGIVAFNIDPLHPHDVAQICGEHNVAIRAGHHCCQPLMQQLDVAATARVSFSIYNDYSDIDVLVNVLNKAREIFSSGNFL